MTIAAEQYDTATGKTRALTLDEAARPAMPGTLVWIDINDPGEEELRRAGRFIPAEFPAGKPPVFERLFWNDTVIAFTLNGACYDETRPAVIKMLVTIIIRPYSFVTVRYRAGGILQTFSTQWHNGRLGDKAFAYSLFLIADSIVDSFLDTSAKIQVQLNLLRRNLDARRIEAVFRLQEQVYELLELLRPYYVTFHELLRVIEGKSDFPQDSTRAYYRHVSDHLQSAEKELYLCLDMLQSVVQEYGNDQANHLNAQVSRLTVLGILLATFQVLVGMFSIDLSRLFPALPPIFSVLIVFGLLAGSGFLELYLLRKKGWLK